MALPTADTAPKQHESLTDLAFWQCALKTDFQAKYGVIEYSKLRRAKAVEERQTDVGTVVYLSRKGRMMLGYTNEHHPSSSALINALFRRVAAEVLEKEGYTKPEPQKYGRYQFGFTSPDGKPVAMVSQMTYRSRSIEVLVLKLQHEFPEVTKLIVFVNYGSHLKKMEQEFPMVEIRELRMVKPRGPAPSREPGLVPGSAKRYPSKARGKTEPAE